jgi:hypothetical protein
MKKSGIHAQLVDENKRSNQKLRRLKSADLLPNLELADTILPNKRTLYNTSSQPLDGPTRPSCVKRRMVANVSTVTFVPRPVSKKFHAWYQSHGWDVAFIHPADKRVDGKPGRVRLKFSTLGKRQLASEL